MARLSRFACLLIALLFASWLMAQSDGTFNNLTVKGLITMPSNTWPGRGPLVIGENNGSDPISSIGYNALPDYALSRPGEPSLAWTIEGDYDDGSGHNKMEAYLQYVWADGSGKFNRAFMTQWDRVTNLPTYTTLSAGINGAILLSMNDGTGTPGTQQFVTGTPMAVFHRTTSSIYTPLFVNAPASNNIPGLNLLQSTSLPGSVLLQAGVNNIGSFLIGQDSVGNMSFSFNGGLLQANGGLTVNGPATLNSALQTNGALILNGPVMTRGGNSNPFTLQESRLIVALAPKTVTATAAVLSSDEVTNPFQLWMYHSPAGGQAYWALQSVESGVAYRNLVMQQYGGNVLVGAAADLGSGARLQVGGAIQLASAAQPTCDAQHRGEFLYVAGATGVKDTVEVCAKDASEAYDWRVIY